MGKPRRLFTREFKVEAVKLVTEQGRSFAEAAANLGIAENVRVDSSSGVFLSAQRGTSCVGRSDR
jgi:hypothetical protein